MPRHIENIFAALPKKPRREESLTLFGRRGVRIERIVSCSYSSPADFWYDQSEEEWFILLRGSATLEFAGGELVNLTEGDHLAIPPHVEHRVRETGPQTVWLAVHVA